MRQLINIMVDSHAKDTAKDRAMAALNSDNKSIEIIPQRLYWISDKNPPKSRTHAFYFCIDNDLVYEPFFADFGPLDLGKVHLFCKELEKLIFDIHEKFVSRYPHSSVSLLVAIFFFISLSLLSTHPPPLSRDIRQRKQS